MVQWVAGSSPPQQASLKLCNDFLIIFDLVPLNSKHRDQKEGGKAKIRRVVDWVEWDELMLKYPELLDSE